MKLDQRLAKHIGNYETDEKERILLALEFATAAHSGQKRRSGDPYITHPVAVAEYLMELRVDPDTVIAALLHDTIEDTDVTPAEIASNFGPEVARLVEGVTKLGEV